STSIIMKCFSLFRGTTADHLLFNNFLGEILFNVFPTLINNLVNASNMLKLLKFNFL
ncbi:MAG: hypothetical protein ACJA0H_002257, partial [Francisellaceae bacterium]